MPNLFTILLLLLLCLCLLLLLLLLLVAAATFLLVFGIAKFWRLLCSAKDRKENEMLF